MDLELHTPCASCSPDMSPEIYVLYLFLSQSKFRAHCTQSTKVKHQYELEMPDKVTGAFFSLVLFSLYQVVYHERELPSQIEKNHCDCSLTKTMLFGMFQSL